MTEVLDDIEVVYPPDLREMPRTAPAKDGRRSGCVFVVGPAHAGKSTFIKALAKVTGLPAAETGDYVAAELASYKRATFPMGKRSGAEWLANVKSAKFYWRKHLVWFGNFGCGIRPSYWIDQAVASGARIIGGVRRLCEVEARARQGFNDFWIEIRRPGHISVDDVCELTCGRVGEFLTRDRYIWIENYGVDGLESSAASWAERVMRMIGE